MLRPTGQTTMWRERKNCHSSSATPNFDFKLVSFALNSVEKRRSFIVVSIVRLDQCKTSILGATRCADQVPSLYLVLKSPSRHSTSPNRTYIDHQLTVFTICVGEIHEEGKQEENLGTFERHGRRWVRSKIC